MNETDRAILTDRSNRKSLRLHNCNAAPAFTPETDQIFLPVIGIAVRCSDRKTVIRSCNRSTTRKISGNAGTGGDLIERVNNDYRHSGDLDCTVPELDSAQQECLLGCKATYFDFLFLVTRR
jgi:hypothetical protein